MRTLGARTSDEDRSLFGWIPSRFHDDGVYIKYTQSGCNQLDKELVDIDFLEGYSLPIPENAFLKDICEFYMSIQN